MSHAGWVFANVLVPYLFPFLIVKVMQGWHLNLKPEQLERLRLTYLLRDAQLSIGSVAIASASFYELLGTPELARHPLWVSLTVALGLLLVANAVLFVCGTAIGSPSPADVVQAGISTREWLKSYPMAAFSMYLAVAVSICAFVAHVFTDEHKANHKVPAATAEPVTKK